MQPLREMAESTSFLAGVATGGVGLVVALAVIAARRRRTGRDASTPRFPGWFGPAFVVCSLVAIRAAQGSGGRVVPTQVVLALATLWLTGEIAARRRVPKPLAAVAALLGGILLASAPDQVGPAWTPLLLLVGPSLAGVAVAGFDRRAAPLGLGPVLWCITLGGMYATVPDTELALALLGAALPLSFLAWPRPLARLGDGGAYASVGLFLWVVTQEGAGRAGSIVGAVGCLALLIAEPVGRAITVRRRHQRHHGVGDRSPRYPALAAQVVLAVYASRIAGFATEPSTAALLLLPAAVIGVAVGAALTIDDPGAPGRGGRRASAGQAIRRRARRAR